MTSFGRGAPACARTRIVARERARLEKELRGAQAALDAADKRLEDPNFTGRAPAAVVEQAQRRAAELREQVAALRARLGSELELEGETAVPLPFMGSRKKKNAPRPAAR